MTEEFKMTSEYQLLEKLTAAGKELGYVGESLQGFVKEQQTILRSERAEAREKEKREHERTLKEHEM